MEFNFSRLKSLIKRDLSFQKKRITIYSIAIFFFCGFVMLLTGDEVYDGMIPPDAGEIVFAALLIVGGIIFTIHIFTEYRTHAERIQYLSLPASHLEKFLSKLFLSLVFFTLITIAIFIIGYIFFGFLLPPIIGGEFVSLFDLKIDIFLLIILTYYIVHAVTLLFASLFNAFPLPKTIVSMGIIWLLSFLVFFICLRVVLYDHFSGIFEKNLESYNYQLDPQWVEKIGTLVENNIPWIVCLIVVPFLWLVTYFKIKEKEA